MTISQYISDFIKKCKDISIETNHVKDGSDNYGLFKSPNRDVKPFTDGSYEIAEYYQFLAKQNTTSEAERREADELLEDLTYWVDDYEYNYGYPEIDGCRTIRSIELTGCPYPMESDDHTALYQMSLKITYSREREE